MTRTSANTAWAALLLAAVVLLALGYLALGRTQSGAGATDAGPAGRGGAAAPAPAAPRVVISEVMADPRAVADEAGEWFEVFNAGAQPLDLRGWTIASENDAPHTIARAVVVEPGGYAVLARDADAGRNGGVAAVYAYGTLTLANGRDWIALRDPSGRTADSVAWARAARAGASHRRTALDAAADIHGAGWTVSAERYGAGDLGRPGGGTLAAAGAAAAPATPARAAAAPASVTSASGAVYRDHLEFGAPAGDARGDVRVRRQEYVLSYNAARGGPSWVAWNVNATHFGDAPRSNRFMADPELPAGVRRVVSTDYTGSGYSRGHMVRSEERTRSAEENQATFLMTNVLPQHQDLNAGPWLQLEQHVQRLAQRERRELYVLAGGIYPPDAPTLKDEGKVAVPSHTWKIVLVLRAGQGVADVRTPADVEVIAVRMPNRAGIATEPWRQYTTTVAELERATGYRFLTALPPAIADALRTRR